jgi:hypothetical protein
MATTIPNTIPNTTGGFIEPVPTLNTTTNSSTSCNITVPDYTTLRQQNIDKINSYYNTILSSYTKNYKDYSTQSASSNVNDRTYANTTLKPKVQNYNSQLINISQSMIDNINQDTDLILFQKNELLEKTRSIDTIMNNIQLLKDKDTDMTVLSQSRKDSLNSSQNSTEDMNFTTYIYIGINMLMILCVIGIVIYLVYSNYSKNTTLFNGKINNNVYKNIMVNK